MSRSLISSVVGVDLGRDTGRYEETETTLPFTDGTERKRRGLKG